MVLLFVSGCAPVYRGEGGKDVARWPYPGLGYRSGAELAPFQHNLFSGRVLEIDPSSRHLYAESGVSGGLTDVIIPEGRVTRILDFGHGVHIENMMFHPRDGLLYVIGSTFSPENLDNVDFARAVLKVDVRHPAIQLSIPLRSSGFCRGLAVHEHKGLLFSLESSSSGEARGATLSRIDLLSDEVVLRRRIGAIPSRVERRGLVLDERTDRLYTLLEEGGERSDFDPVGKSAEDRVSYLAVLDTDSLRILDRYTLPGGLDYTGIVATPRGVLVMGVNRNVTSLMEFDTRFRREGGSLGLPEPASDMVADDRSALFPSARGVYVVDLESMSLDGILPLPLAGSGEMALAPDGRLSCVILRGPERTRGPALGVVNLETGTLEKLIQ